MLQIQRRWITPGNAVRLIGLAAFPALAFLPPVATLAGPKDDVAKIIPYRAAPTGTQKITVVVDGGFSPSSIWVRPRERTELTFIRKERDVCGGTILLPGMGVKRRLMPGQKTTVTFTPDTSQLVRFTCGMKMYQGHVAVMPNREQAIALARAAVSGKSCCSD